MTLAEVVQNAGWRTIAISDGRFVSPSFGLAQGFDRFDVGGGGIAASSRKLLSWIDDCDAQRQVRVLLDLLATNLGA